MRLTSRLGRSQYTIDDEASEHVRITRINSDGEAVMYVPFDLLVDYVVESTLAPAMKKALKTGRREK